MDRALYENSRTKARKNRPKRYTIKNEFRKDEAESNKVIKITK